MAFKKSAPKIIAALLFTGLFFGTGISSYNGLAHEATGTPIFSAASNQQAVDTLNDFYIHAFSGEMPGNVQGLQINESNKQDVHNKLGKPVKVDGQFDLYSWDMGNPGYGFAYNKDNSISEIRNFGTAVERQTNLGDITPDLLGNQLGSADKILNVPRTDETDYVYETGKYEIHFIIGDNPIMEGPDQTVNHVNLKEAK